MGSHVGRELSAIKERGEMCQAFQRTAISHDQSTWGAWRKMEAQGWAEGTLYGNPRAIWRRKWQPNSSVLAWRIPGTGEPGGLPSMGSHRVRHN